MVYLLAAPVGSALRNDTSKMAKSMPVFNSVTSKTFPVFPAGILELSAHCSQDNGSCLLKKGSKYGAVAQFSYIFHTLCP